MQKGTYYERARAIHGDKFQPQESSHSVDELNEIWAKTVNNKQSAKEFFQKYYPAFTEQMCEAFADYLDRGVRGEIKLDEKLTNLNLPVDTRWDYKKEVQEQYMQGKIKLTEKRLDDLLREEEEKTK